MAAGLVALLLIAVPLGGGQADEVAGRIEITGSGTHPTMPGPAQRFTGMALVRELFGAHAGLSRL